MNNLQYRQEKIQAKRKQTPWREFVMEICSRGPLVFNKNLGLVSKFPVTDRSSITSYKDFNEYRDDLLSGDGEQHFSDSFFQEFNRLWHTIKFPPMVQRGSNENSEYVDIALACKNSYLSIGLVTDVENILYSRSVKDNTSNVQNSVMVRNNCDNIYSSLSIIQSFNIFFSKFIDNSSNIWFSSNLLGCQECIFCNDLQNQNYCIDNVKYEKEEYYIRKQKLLSQKNDYSIYCSKVSTYSTNILSQQVTGNGIIESENIDNGYLVYNVQGGKNLFLGGATEENRNIYDAISFGSPWCRDIYGGYSINFEHVYCSAHSAGSSYIFYSYFLESCSFCLGCVGLKNKSYCILNKQYTKEERYQKIDEIFQKMEDEGTLGEFFPASMNPFYFNDTAAYLIDNSFTKEEVTTKGYLWRDEPIKVDVPEGAKVVKTNELDQYEGRKDASSGTIVKDLTAGSGDASTSSAGRIRWIDPEILKVIIQDDQGNIYKIVKMEYDFLVKHGLPLPRQHRLDRMKNNFKI